ncbi:hypothetical protein LCGC14_3138260 [marine sediment metagenome]|uniref:Uncharacterized protein n=1 Tax=marine sediment metagenome TaxID=412755 RepID=A0A0F8VXN5_9ZZZZ
MERVNDGELELKNIHYRQGFGYVFDKGYCPHNHNYCHRDCMAWWRVNKEKRMGCEIALAEAVYKKLTDQERKDLKVKDEFGNWPDQSIQSRIAEVEEMAERTKESVRLDEIAKSNAIGMGLIEPDQTYTLNCDKCNDPYDSPRAFPRPQLCDKCKPDRSSRLLDEDELAKKRWRARQ